MALTTYANLKSRVGEFVNRNDLTAYIDDICTLGEKWVNRNIRVRAMELPLTSTIGASVAGAIVLPSDYVEAKSLYIDTSPTHHLRRKSLDFMYDNYPTRSSAGTPKFFAREQGNLIFGPYPSSAYVIKGTYYRRFAALSSTINGMFTDNPDIYLFAALAETEVFLKNDSRVPLWIGKRDAVAKDMMSEDSDEEDSGSDLAISPG